jgi:hypothetical protein
VVSPALATDPIDAATAHNSSQQGIRITRGTAAGRYHVLFEGLNRQTPTTQRETFHVTAYGDGTNWCNIRAWNPPSSGSPDLQLDVDCYDAGGTPADARFAVLMLESGRSGRRLGYVWANQSATATYTPSELYSFNSAGGLNTASWQSQGVYWVTWGGLSRIAGSTAETNLVTSYGAVTWCQVRSWGSEITSVICFDRTGAPVNSLYTAIWIE